jgi:hypothetical protein
MPKKIPKRPTHPSRPIASEPMRGITFVASGTG